MLAVVQRTPLLAPLIALLVLLATGSAAAAEMDPQQLEFFEKQVRPLLAAHCYECHSVHSKSLKANLRLDSRQAILKGGDTGPAVTLDKRNDSPLLEAIRYESFEMPPKGKLPEKDIAVFEKWIGLGAPWPNEPEPVVTNAKPGFDLNARKASHWCWQPIKTPALPAVRDESWPRSDLDRFILVKLEDKGFKPAATVDRRVLIRRLSFDLIGLPPTPAEINAFVNDTAPNAVEKVVDQLLESPQFGERWARHWLDLVRYAESRGHEFDNDASNSWQYRDYVIRALNADVPYDQFVREHIAGDLLNPPRLNPERGFNESILGTGFWHLGEWVHSPVDIRKDETDRFDNMLDVMSKTFLGVTVSCARCHDHKFDAISQKDYYALSGFLQGSDYRQVPFEALEHNQWLAGELAKIDAEANRKIWRLVAIEQKRSAELLRFTTRRHGGVRYDDPGELPIGLGILFDYRATAETAILQDGVVYGGRAVRPGELILRDQSDGTKAIEVVRAGFARCDPLWKAQVYTVAASANQKGRLESFARSGRTLRSPTFEVSNAKVSCRIRGSGTVVACVDSHRLIAGPLHGETVVEVPASADDGWKWVTLNLSRYLGHRVHLEFSPAKDQTLDVQLATCGPPEPTQLLNAETVDLPAVMKILEAWEEGRVPELANRKWLAAIASAALNDVPMSKNAVDQIAHEKQAWLEQRDEVRAGISTFPALAPAMLDGTGEDDHILIRGNSSSPGEIAPRRFLEAVDGDKPLAIPNGSGRLELAARITDPANPLTTRVIVNRLWQHLLGRGIVPTVDDFGALGQPPSHPELLDHLAIQFVADGHSLKKTIRRIVLSQTYRMSGQVDPVALEADPKNLLWHHLPPKRLEGEVIRDALLAVSGKLDPTLYGRSIPVHLTTFMEGRGRPPQSGPVDGANRRSIYQEVRRNFLSPFMLTFDTPNPFSTMGRRNFSNVPAQALILLNDPFVRDCAEAWAKRGLHEGPADATARIQWFYETGLGRAPTGDETKLLAEFLADQSTGRDPANELAPWTSVAHAIINTKEFIFLK